MKFGRQTHLASVVFKMCQKVNRKLIQHDGGGHIELSYFGHIVAADEIMKPNLVEFFYKNSKY